MCLLTWGGGVALETQNFDNTYLLSFTPRLHNYLYNRFEVLADYTFILQKTGTLAGKKKIGYNQFGSALRYFPLQKLNILYVEGGFQVGNYGIKKQS